LKSIFDSIFDRCSSAFKQKRTKSRVKELAHGLLTCTGRATITGMLIAVGRQFMDWTAAYQVFWGSRMNTEKLFEVALQVGLEQLTPQQHIVAHMDDTIIRKVGKTIPGTSWRRDPLGPAFHTNFIWAQRFIQMSLSLHDATDFNSQSRAIAVDFHHSPSVKKIAKNASDEDTLAFKESKKQQNLSTQGVSRIKLLRSRLDQQHAQNRELLLSVDGSYTNKTVLKQLPDRVTLIGRVRKDATLNYLPESEKTKGRNRKYGDPAPTPEQIRQSQDHPWHVVIGWAAGKKHNFNVKIIKSLKWRTAGQDHTLQLVVIRPLGYRLKKGGKLLYRNPAYLVCTDNDLDVETLLQAYLWRWEIEVNFRDEKSTNGCGQAQVHNEIAAVKVPQFVVAMHAFVHLADYIIKKSTNTAVLPRAKWELKNKQLRSSTNNILNHFRGYYICEKIGKSFSDFIANQQQITNDLNPITNFINPIFYIRR
jgi:hypothetical protein